MGVDHKIIRTVQGFKGLDKRSSDLDRSSEYATDIVNADYRNSGAITKRKGFHTISGNSAGGYGMTTYKDINTTTGAITDTVLAVDNNLNTITIKNMIITYSPPTSDDHAWYSMYRDPDSKQFVFKILVNDEYVLTESLGTGFETADMNVTQLQVKIHALTNFTCTNDSEINSMKAAFFDVVDITEVPSTGESIEYRYWSTVTNGDSAITTTFPMYTRNQDNLGDAELENATFAQLNNVMYISNGQDEVMKYDGEYVYRAGLPNAKLQVSQISESGSSGVDIGVHDYRVVYEYTDKKGNIITSVASDAVTFTCTSSSREVTINFSANVPLDVGTGSYSDALNGFDKTGQDGSGNQRLKVKIYRNKAYVSTAGDLYLVATVDFDAASYVDTTTDGALNTLLPYEIPSKRHDPPPKGKYLTAFKNSLIISGMLTDVNNVAFSHYYDISTGEIGSEYFPNNNNQEIINSLYGDSITGMAPLRDVLYIFHKNSIHVISGDVTDVSLYVVDLLTAQGNIGCESHSSIAELNGELFFLSSEGVYSINASNVLREVSELVKPLITNSTATFKRATSFDWVGQNSYLLILPEESLDKSDATVDGVETVDTVSTNTGTAWIAGTYNDVTYTNQHTNVTASFNITIAGDGTASIEVATTGGGYAVDSTFTVDDSEIGDAGGDNLTFDVATLLKRAYTTDTTSVILVYDYFKQAWLKWSGIDFTGGIVLSQNKIYMNSRRKNTSLATLEPVLNKISSTNSKYDYTDHEEVITFSYNTSWESLGEPTLYKKFLRLKVHSMDAEATFESAGFDLDVAIERNYVASSVGSITIDFGEGSGLGWGGDEWGNFPWGNVALNAARSKLPSGKAQSIRLLFSNNTANENILITSYEYELAAPFRMEIKD